MPYVCLTTVETRYMISFKDYTNQEIQTKFWHAMIMKEKDKSQHMHIHYSIIDNSYSIHQHLN